MWIAVLACCTSPSAPEGAPPQELGTEAHVAADSHLSEDQPSGQGIDVEFCDTGTLKCTGVSRYVVCAEDRMWSHWPRACEPRGICLRSGSGDQCIDACEASEKLDQKVGCEFLSVATPSAVGINAGAMELLQYGIAVLNPSPFEATVKLYRTDTTELLKTVAVPPGAMEVFDVDVSAEGAGTVAYRVHADVPIEAYQFNPYHGPSGVFSADGSRLLPVHAFGTRHRVISQRQTRKEFEAYLVLVAPTPATVWLDTVVAVRINGASTEPPVVVDVSPSVPVLVETMQPGDDLTGVLVSSSAPVGVFAGVAASNLPDSIVCQDGACGGTGLQCQSIDDCSIQFPCCSDHLEEMLTPTKRWGMEFYLGKSSPRGSSPDVWRVVADVDNTIVTLTPSLPSGPLAVLSAGEWVEFQSTVDHSVHSTKPVQVARFLVSQEAASNSTLGDPASELVPPAFAFRDEVLVIVPPDYMACFLNVVRQTNTWLQLDGSVIGDELLVPVGVGHYEVGQIATTAGLHVVRGEEPAGVSVYCFGDYVSVAMPTTH